MNGKPTGLLAVGAAFLAFILLGRKPPPPAPGLVSIRITGPDTVVEGESIQLTATGRWEDGTESDITSIADWSSSAPDVAVVAHGVVTGVAEGDATIQTSLETVSGVFEVSVTAASHDYGMTGVVTDSDTHLVIPGAAVSIVGMPGSSVITDTDGVFTITGWMIDTCNLSVSCAGYVARIVSVTGLVDGEITDIGAIELAPASANPDIVLADMSPPLRTVYVDGVSDVFVEAEAELRNNGGATGYMSYMSMLGSVTGQGGTATIAAGDSVWVSVGVKIRTAGTYTYQLLLGGVVVYSQTITAVLAAPSHGWMQIPPSSLALGGYLSAAVYVSNGYDVPITFTIWLRTFLPAGAGASYVTLKYKVAEVVQPGQLMTYSGGFVAEWAGTYRTQYQITYGGVARNSAEYPTVVS